MTADIGKVIPQGGFSACDGYRIENVKIDFLDFFKAKLGGWLGFPVKAVTAFCVATVCYEKSQDFRRNHRFHLTGEKFFLLAYTEGTVGAFVLAC
jgi:hypothetical protein